MALRNIISSKIPVVIILGATGTGKTKLSVELAQKFNTEIISADSMQIYKGLDIVTAKASLQERETVRHHLLDILDPLQMFTVVDFRNRALKIKQMENLIENAKIPIIVGGTNYYIESIVYQILVENMDDTEALLWDKSRRKRDFADDVKSDEEIEIKRIKDVEGTEIEVNNISATTLTTKEHCLNTEDNIVKTKENLEEGVVPGVDNTINKDKLKEVVDNERKFSNEEIHLNLKLIDPEMASKLHPNNRRKVLRSIEVWLKTGRRHSEILAEQQVSEGKLRRPGATIIFWLTCEQSVHDERLNSRVESMLREGLINELLDFHDRYNKQRMKDGQPPDYTKGVFQTLGFKEFHDYLMMTEEARNTEEGKKLLELSIENMKMATRRYARRQNKMIKGRFLEHPNREVPPIWTLDTTEITKWDEMVKNKAIKIIESFIKDSPCPFTPIKTDVDKDKTSINSKSNNYCSLCERLIIGDKEFKIHLNSNRHKKVLKKKNRLEQSSGTKEK